MSAMIKIINLQFNWLGNPFKQITQTLLPTCNFRVPNKGYFLIQRGDFIGTPFKCPSNTSYVSYDGNFCKGQSVQMKGKYTYTHSITSQVDCRPSKTNKLVYWKGLYTDGKPDKESCGSLIGKKFNGYNLRPFGGNLQCGSCYRYTGSAHTMDCK